MPSEMQERMFFFFFLPGSFWAVIRPQDPVFVPIYRQIIDFSLLELIHLHINVIQRQTERMNTESEYDTAKGCNLRSFYKTPELKFVI